MKSHVLYASLTNRRIRSISSISLAGVSLCAAAAINSFFCGFVTGKVSQRPALLGVGTAVLGSGDYFWHGR
jgi:hypothetical protein